MNDQQSADARGNFTFTDTRPSQQPFRDAVFEGLSRPIKSVPSKYIYDEEGSRFFEAVCQLPEYYPTRTEIGILRRNLTEIGTLVGPDARMVEFGSGATVKIRLLLSGLEHPAVYVPIDISSDHLRAGAMELAQDYPDVMVTALAADFMRPIELPPAGRPHGPSVGFFPGSTIGNFTPEEAIQFLRRARDLLDGGGLIIGVDLKKDPARLEAAYNDPGGVSARFNGNLLGRMQRDLDAKLDRDGFRHYAIYEADVGRMAIGLESLREQQIEIGGQRFHFDAGERLHTQHAYKFSVLEFKTLVERANFTTEKVWVDDDRLFSVHFLRA